MLFENVEISTKWYESFVREGVKRYANNEFVAKLMSAGKIVGHKFSCVYANVSSGTVTLQFLFEYGSNELPVYVLQLDPNSNVSVDRMVLLYKSTDIKMCLFKNLKHDMFIVMWNCEVEAKEGSVFSYSAGELKVVAERR